MSSADIKELGISDRQLGAWEIASVVSSVLIAEWIISSVAGNSRVIVSIPIVFALTFMIASHVLRGEGLRDVGFRFDNFFKACLRLLVPMIVFGAACLMIGRWSGRRPEFGGWHPGTPILVQLALGFL